jgi:hypothetical protein
MAIFLFFIPVFRKFSGLRDKPAARFSLAVILLAAGLLLAATFLLAAPTAQAAPTNEVVSAAKGPQVQAKAGFDGSYRLNSWLPLQIDLSLADGNPNFEGWVEASFSNFDDGSTIYRRAVQLVPPANRQAWLYLPTGTRNIGEVQLRLTAKDGTVVNERNLAVRPLDQTELLIGVVSDDNNALAVLSGRRLTQPFNKGSIFYNPGYNGSSARPNTSVPAIRVAHLTPTDLPPDPSGWDSLDGLVLSDLSSITLNDQNLNQDSLKDAAAAWLAQGRFLLLAGDSSLRRGGFLDAFLPVKAGGSPQNKPFPADLRKLTTEATAPASLLVADSTLLPGATAALTLDNKPFLASKAFGLGVSWFSATDLRVLPSSTLVGLMSLSLKDFEPHTAYLAGLRQPSDLYRPWTNQLNPNTKIATLPDVAVIAFILVIYVFVLGPVCYFVLKRMDKREWGWVAAPVVALTLTAGFYIAGLVTSGEPLVLSRLSIITLGQDAQGHLVGGTSSVGTLYSSKRIDDLQLNVSDQAESTPLSRYRTNNLTARGGNVNLAPDFATIQQGPGGGYGNVLMGQDDQRSFAFESSSSATLSGGIVAQLATGAGNDLTGTIENQTGQDWVDISVWKAEGTIYQLPLLKAGEKITLDKGMAIVKFDNLASALAGIDYTVTNPYSSIQNTDPQVYQNHKAAAVASLLGNDGEALPKDPNRVYIVAWQRASNNFPLQLGNHAASGNDLTLLFEPLVLS